MSGVVRSSQAISTAPTATSSSCRRRPGRGSHPTERLVSPWCSGRATGSRTGMDAWMRAAAPRRVSHHRPLASAGLAQRALTPVDGGGTTARSNRTARSQIWCRRTGRAAAAMATDMSSSQWLVCSSTWETPIPGGTETWSTSAWYPHALSMELPLGRDTSPLIAHSICSLGLRKWVHAGPGPGAGNCWIPGCLVRTRTSGRTPFPLSHREALQTGEWAASWTSFRAALAAWTPAESATVPRRTSR